MQRIQLMAFQYRISKIFEYISEQQSIQAQIVVVVLLQNTYFKMRPRLLGAFIVFWIQSFASSACSFNES